MEDMAFAIELPRLEKFGGEVLADEDTSLTTITTQERKGLRAAGIALLIYVAIRPWRPGGSG